MYNGLKDLWGRRERQTERDRNTLSLYSFFIKPVASCSHAKSPCFGIWREVNIKAYLQFLFLVGLSLRQLYDPPHGKAFHCDSKTESLLKGQHRSHMLLHAKRKKKKSAVYDPKHHFIRLRWKLSDSFSNCPCPEGRSSAQSNIPLF